MTKLWKALVLVSLAAWLPMAWWLWRHEQVHRAQEVWGKNVTETLGIVSDTQLRTVDAVGKIVEILHGKKHE